MRLIEIIKHKYRLFKLLTAYLHFVALFSRVSLGIMVILAHPHAIPAREHCTDAGTGTLYMGGDGVSSSLRHLATPTPAETPHALTPWTVPAWLAVGDSAERAVHSKRFRSARP
jgi:hypothetical protein